MVHYVKLKLTCKTKKKNIEGENVEWQKAFFDEVENIHKGL